MTPPAPPTGQVPYDLTGLDSSVIRAIEKEASERGVSFEEAMKQMLLEHSRQLQRQQKSCIPSFIARLFGSARVH